jgi:hypothetical protein
VALVLAVPFLGSFFAAIQVGRGWVEASLLAVGSSLLTLFWWGVFTLVWVFLTIFNTFF